MQSTLVGPIKAQPRLVTASVLGVLLWFVLPGRPETRLLAAWDGATAAYLILALGMMARSNVDRIRGRSAEQDEGRVVILGLTTVTALVSLAGVMFELARAKSYPGHGGWHHVALAGITVVLSWTFLHTIFAVHYAHEYYSGPRQGLEFPGHEPPDYWDFA